MKFEITKEDQEKIDKWLTDEVYPIMIERQKASGIGDANPFIRMCWEKGRPYEGGIGGGLTYIFTPTSLGTAFTVKYLEWELNLTDYDSW